MPLIDSFDSVAFELKCLLLLKVSVEEAVKESVGFVE